MGRLGDGTGGAGLAWLKSGLKCLSPRDRGPEVLGRGALVTPFHQLIESLIPSSGVRGHLSSIGPPRGRGAPAGGMRPWGAWLGVRGNGFRGKRMRKVLRRHNPVGSKMLINYLRISIEGAEI